MDNNIKIISKEKNLEININKIEKIFDKKISYPNSQYIIRKIEKNKKIKNEEISTISLINTEYKIIHIFNSNLNIKNIEIKFPYDYNKKDAFYISIITFLYNDKEKFVYNLIDSDDIEIINDDNNKDKSVNYVIIIIIIVLAIILIITGVAVYLFIKKKRVNKDLTLKEKLEFNYGKLLNEDENEIAGTNIN